MTPGNRPSAQLAPDGIPRIDAVPAEDYALRVTGIAKQFAGRQVLCDLTVDLRQRGVLALCGVSGSGKTTLLRIVAGLVSFDAGELRVGGVRVGADAPYPTDLYGKVGFVSQDHTLFPHMTALRNVTLALTSVKRLSREDANERGMAELERLGVASRAQEYPGRLSGGERQRVAIARTLALDPLLLLLDEPTAQLDPDRTREVRDRVLKLSAAGVTMVLVTHNVWLARQVASSFALLQNGRCYVSDSPTLFDSLSQREG